MQNGCTQAVVSASLMNMKGEDRASWPVEGATPTQTADRQHIVDVRAFLLKYYGASDLLENAPKLDGHGAFPGVGIVSGQWARRAPRSAAASPTLKLLTKGISCQTADRPTRM